MIWGAGGADGSEARFAEAQAAGVLRVAGEEKKSAGAGDFSGGHAQLAARHMSCACVFRQVLGDLQPTATQGMPHWMQAASPKARQLSPGVPHLQQQWAKTRQLSNFTLHPMHAGIDGYKATFAQ